MAYNVNFKRGTIVQYSTLSLKDQQTFYLITNEDSSVDLYLGELKLSNASDLTKALLRIAENETDIAGILSSLEVLNGANTVDGSIAKMIKDATDPLINRIGEAESDIAAEAQTARAAEKALDDRIKSLEDNSQAGAVSALEKKVTDLETLTAGHTTTLTQVDTDISSLEGKVSGLEGRMGDAEANIDDLEASMRTLIGSDTGEDGVNAGKSVRTIASEEVAKIVLDAPESLDTLEEIASWIQNDTTGAAKMAKDIEDLKTSDGLQDGKIQTNTNNIAVNTGNISTNTTGIATNKKDIENLTGEFNSFVDDANNNITGYVATANKYTNSEISGLVSDYSLENIKSAAYQDEDYFEVAGAAAELVGELGSETTVVEYVDQAELDAVNASKDYVDTALTWQLMQ